MVATNVTSSSSLKQPALAPGLQDAVHDAQSVFSTLMQAMARPGRIYDLPVLPEAPAPLLASTGAALLTLADYDTNLWLDVEDEMSNAAREWLSFHTGAPFVEEPTHADFAVATDINSRLDLEAFSPGDPEYPDRSTTLIVQVETLENASSWSLTGPGIETDHPLSVSTMPENFIDQWQHNRAVFPLGIDVILCAPTNVVCLPRTVQITEAV
ncbi:MAG: phosphonate C-P lyase system protein PhnH [Pseudomonadota bacterium]